MSNAQADTLVLKDEAGRYYLLPLETLERGRVPAEHTTELERLITTATEADAGGADTEGYAAHIVGAVAYIVFRAGFDLGYALGNYLNSPAQTVPTLDYSHAAEDTTPR